LKVNREIYKGQNYNVVEWRKVVLYPQRVGELEISPLSLNLVLDVPTDKRDFFGNVIYDQTSQIISTGMRRIMLKIYLSKENLIVFLEQLEILSSM
jgi:hypothetical protein